MHMVRIVIVCFVINKFHNLTSDISHLILVLIDTGTIIKVE